MSYQVKAVANRPIIIIELAHSGDLYQQEENLLKDIKRYAVGIEGTPHIVYNCLGFENDSAKIQHLAQQIETTFGLSSERNLETSLVGCLSLLKWFSNYSNSNNHIHLFNSVEEAINTLT